MTAFFVGFCFWCTTLFAPLPVELESSWFLRLFCETALRDRIKRANQIIAKISSTYSLELLSLGTLFCPPSLPFFFIHL
jgi:hypothetical protein